MVDHTTSEFKGFNMSNGKKKKKKKKKKHLNKLKESNNARRDCL